MPFKSSSRAERRRRRKVYQKQQRYEKQRHQEEDDDDDSSDDDDDKRKKKKKDDDDFDSDVDDELDPFKMRKWKKMPPVFLAGLFLCTVSSIFTSSLLPAQMKHPFGEFIFPYLLWFGFLMMAGSFCTNAFPCIGCIYHSFMCCGDGKSGLLLMLLEPCFKDCPSFCPVSRYHRHQKRKERKRLQKYKHSDDDDEDSSDYDSDDDYEYDSDGNLQI